MVYVISGLLLVIIFEIARQVFKGRKRVYPVLFFCGFSLFGFSAMLGTHEGAVFMAMSMFLTIYGVYLIGMSVVRFFRKG